MCYNHTMELRITDSAILGVIIARRRKERGLGQAEVSGDTGINRSSWSRIEKGDMAVDIEQLGRIAKTLDTTPEALLKEMRETREKLEQAGYKAAPKQPKKSKVGWAVLAGAALGALLAAGAAAAKKSDDDSTGE